MEPEEKKFRITITNMGETESFIMNREDTNNLYREHIEMGTFDEIYIEEIPDFI